MRPGAVPVDGADHPGESREDRDRRRDQAVRACRPVQKEGTKGEPFDIAFEGWVADYTDPYDFINVLLDGKAIQDSNNVNFSYFNDPKYNQKMEKAAGLGGEDRFKNYGKLDLEIAKNASPLAAWDNDNERDFFSGRMGCQLYQPVYGMDIAAMCLRA